MTPDDARSTTSTDLDRPRPGRGPNDLVFDPLLLDGVQGGRGQVGGLTKINNSGPVVELTDRPGPAPIETQYRGYRFRSRLEARWAVVFDALGWEWTYEIEGYELRGGRYLPDFHIRLPEGMVRWWEIKPPRESQPPAAAVLELRWLDLVAATGQVLVVAHGMPESASHSWDVWTLEPVPAAGGADGIRVTVSGYGLAADRMYGAWDAALRAGRSARFEHDERDHVQRAAGDR